MSEKPYSIEDIYNDLREIQNLVWQSDDLMSQDTLFEIQDKLADLMLKVAISAGKEENLARSFPWLYRIAREGENE